MKDTTTAIFQDPDTGLYTKNQDYIVDVNTEDETDQLANHMYFIMDFNTDYTQEQYEEIVKKASISMALSNLIDAGLVEMITGPDGEPVYRIKEKK